MRLFAVILFLIGLALAYTNPGPERFERFVDESVAHVVAAEAGTFPGGSMIGQLGGALAARLATRYTNRRNLILFSIYTIDLAPVGLPGEEWRFLGIGYQFIELHRPEALQ